MARARPDRFVPMRQCWGAQIVALKGRRTDPKFLRHASLLGWDPIILSGETSAGISLPLNARTRRPLHLCSCGCVNGGRKWGGRGVIHPRERHRLIHARRWRFTGGTASARIDAEKPETKQMPAVWVED